MYGIKLGSGAMLYGTEVYAADSGRWEPIPTAFVACRVPFSDIGVFVRLKQRKK